jgi:hypothetical protein
MLRNRLIVYILSSMKMQNRHSNRTPHPLKSLTPTQKTTRTVCNHPQANLLKNNSKAKITKNTYPTNSLHI